MVYRLISLEGIKIQECGVMVLNFYDLPASPALFTIEAFHSAQALWGMMGFLASIASVLKPLSLLTRSTLLTLCNKT